MKRMFKVYLLGELHAYSHDIDRIAQNLFKQAGKKVPSRKLINRWAHDLNGMVEDLGDLIMDTKKE